MCHSCLYILNKITQTKDLKYNCSIRLVSLNKDTDWKMFTRSSQSPDSIFSNLQSVTAINCLEATNCVTLLNPTATTAWGSQQTITSNRIFWLCCVAGALAHKQAEKQVVAPTEQAEADEGESECFSLQLWRHLTLFKKSTDPPLNPERGRESGIESMQAWYTQQRSMGYVGYSLDWKVMRGRGTDGRRVHVSININIKPKPIKLKKNPQQIASPNILFGF